MKNFFGRSAAGLAIAGVLTITACNGGTTTPDDLTTVLASSQGQAFVTALGSGGNLIPGMSKVLADVNAGVVDAANDLPFICTALPWADKALDVLGPMAKVDPSTIAETDSAVAAFERGPCAAPPANLAAAVGQGASMWTQVNAILKAGGVPVAAPTVTPATGG